MRVSEAAVRATVVETELEGLKAARAQQQKKHAGALVQAVAATEDEAVSGWLRATVATYDRWSQRSGLGPLVGLGERVMRSLLSTTWGARWCARALAQLRLTVSHAAHHQHQAVNLISSRRFLTRVMAMVWAAMDWWQEAALRQAVTAKERDTVLRLEGEHRLALADREAQWAREKAQCQAEAQESGEYRARASTATAAKLQ